MSDLIKRERQVWYCKNCGRTFERGNNDPKEMACDNCNTWPMRSAWVYWYDEKPDPDPLDALLIESVQ